MGKNKFKMGSRCSASLVAGGNKTDGLTFQGIWNVECVDKEGNVKWSDNFKNLVVNEGLNHILNTEFHGDPAVSPWFIGLVNDAPTFAAGDTLASHGGWTEFTNYTGNRLAWTEDAAASQSITNTSAVSFPILGIGTIAGAFLSSVATGTAGTLFSAGAFTAGDRTVANGDFLNVTYTLNAADA